MWLACKGRSSGFDVEPELAFRDDRKPKEQNMKTLQVTILVVSLAGAMGAKAQVPVFVNPPETTWSPPWEGGAPYQRDIYLNMSVNPEGSPSPTGIPGAQYAGYLDPVLMSSDYVSFSGAVQYFSAAQSPDGVAGIGIVNNGTGVVNGTAEFVLGNTEEGAEKYMWVENTAKGSSTGLATLSASAPEGYAIANPITIIGTTPQANGTYVNDWGFIITPNPPWEDAEINFSIPAGQWAVVNTLQIATECVPEPATFSLLALGGLALLLRRRS